MQVTGCQFRAEKKTEVETKKCVLENKLVAGSPRRYVAGTLT